MGALVGKVLPDWLLVVSLVLLLAHTTYTTLDKARSQYKKETAVMDAAKKSILIQVKEEIEEKEEKVSLLDAVGGPEEEEEGAGVQLTASASASAPAPAPDSANNLISIEEAEPHKDPDQLELEELLERESKTPMDKVKIISVMVAVVIVLNLLKGGSGNFPSPLGIACGSSAYWGLTGLVFVWVIGISLWSRNDLIARWRQKRRLRYRYLPGDVEWNERNTIVYPCLCFFAGFFAGMFGIGGGIVKGPLMLQMGVHPLVASATTAVMIMFTSVAATTMFIAFGTLTWDYAWFLFVVGLITTTVGQFGVSYLVEKYKRYSFISMSIGAVVALSTVLMAVQSVFSLVDAQAGGGKASGVCS